MLKEWDQGGWSAGGSQVALFLPVNPEEVRAAKVQGRKSDSQGWEGWVGSSHEGLGTLDSGM